MNIRDLFGVLIIALIIALLASPLLVAVIYPGSGENAAKISATLVPWTIILLLFLVFNEGIKGVFSSIERAIDRMKKIGTGSSVTEFESDQSKGIHLSEEDAEILATEFKSLQEQTTTETTWAWHYYLKYIAVTIYRSQIELLAHIKDQGAADVSECMRFYHTFLSREPSASSYEFTSYMEYLTSNNLISIDSETGKYSLATHGERFLEEIESSGISMDKFSG